MEEASYGQNTCVGSNLEPLSYPKAMICTDRALALRFTNRGSQLLGYVTQPGYDVRHICLINIAHIQFDPNLSSEVY